MRFFERASPKPADPFEALLQYLDGQAEEVDEARLAEMQYGWKSHQGRVQAALRRFWVQLAIVIRTLASAVAANPSIKVLISRCGTMYPEVNPKPLPRAARSLRRDGDGKESAGRN